MKYSLRGKLSPPARRYMAHVDNARFLKFLRNIIPANRAKLSLGLKYKVSMRMYGGRFLSTRLPATRRLRMHLTDGWMHS